MLLPTRPEMEGKNRWQDKDTKGAFLIQGIIKSAREGDGAGGKSPLHGGRLDGGRWE